MTILIGTAALIAAWIVLVLMISLKARAAITRKVVQGGRTVLGLRGKLLRSPFAEGLTPLAFVYRVTTQSDDAAKTVTKLYAYDPGAWFSRHAAHVRQFSGGVWRDA